MIPDVDSGGAALWPDGGFEVGRTSALFEHVNTNGSGGIEIYFDKINGEPIILTGLEIEAAAVPEPRSVVIYSLLIVCVIGLSRWRRRPRNGGGSPRSPRIEVRLPGGE